jgi:hypothetical protein
VTEPQPHRADTIEHLDAAEQALYRDLRAIAGRARAAGAGANRLGRGVGADQLNVF